MELFIVYCVPKLILNNTFGLWFFNSIKKCNEIKLKRVYTCIAIAKFIAYYLVLFLPVILEN